MFIFERRFFVMKANSNTMTHEATPVVSELNKVAGFNPLKFIRKTDRG